MPNYFKIKNGSAVELSGSTIEGEGKKGTGNAAEQFVAETLKMQVEDIKEITKEEFEILDKNK